MKRELLFRAWDGNDSTKHKDGEYIYVKAEWHPNANKRGYVKRHRLVLERKLGYYLPKRSIVHHLNGNKRDDSESNLSLVPNQSLHSKSHDTGVRNSNGQFVADDPIFNDLKFRLYNKHTQQYEIYTLSKLIRTTFRNSQFSFAGRHTGLKDKNGKEVYEGDIITGTEGKYSFIVKMRRDSWKAVSFDERDVFSIPDHWEVIGNQFENPELIDFNITNNSKRYERHR